MISESSSDSEYELEGLRKNKRAKLLWKDSSSDSSSSDSEDKENKPRAPRHFRERPDHFKQWNDLEFKSRFRLNKATVMDLFENIKDSLVQPLNRNYGVLPITQLLLVLRLLATGSMYTTTGDFVGVHKSTVCRIVKRVLDSICGLAVEYIKMPSTPDDIAKKQLDFFTIAKFPKVIGAIDCTHIKIQSPGGQNAEYFRNRKGFFSINVQVVTDANLFIQDIVARWPGSTHDQTIFINSKLCSDFERGKFENAILLGDSGYAIRKYLITPHPHPTSPAEMLFQESQIRTRNPIERLFGIWKRRFPILSLGIRLSLLNVKKVIIACAVLHNIAKQFNDEPPEDEVHIDNVDVDVQPNQGGHFRQPFIDYFANL